MQVRNLMQRPVVSVGPDASVRQAARQMREHVIGSVIVTDGDRLAGILTERDVLRAVARGIRDDAVVRDWMTTDPDTIEPGDTTEHAATLMMHGGFRHLPVTENGAVVGILSIRDLMRIVLEDSAPRGV
jgi:CBS domain-containing protein